MSTLQNFVEFLNQSEMIENPFYADLRCMLENELLSNPIGFSIKYRMTMTLDEYTELHNQALFLISRSPIPTCPTTSGNITMKHRK